MSSHPHQVTVEPTLKWLRVLIEGLSVPRLKRRPEKETFGQRLKRLRKASGLTQTQLGDKVGLSYRMIAYYESQGDRPPSHVLPELARALGVSVDQILGVSPLRASPPMASVKLWRRLKRIEDLPPSSRRAVLKVLDDLLAAHPGADQA